MKRIFKSDETAQTLFQNLRQTLIETRQQFEELLGKLSKEEASQLEQIQKKVESVNISLKKLNQLIDIHNFPPNRWKRMNFYPPIEEAISKLQEYAYDKKITLEVKQNELKGKGIIYGDQRILSQFVYENIISNAIKFSPKDSSIEIETDEDKEHYFVRITDHGQGIPREFLSSLYPVEDRFYYLGTSGESGSGMSIPIIKMVMGKLNGHVEYRSITDQENDQHGTTVILSFNKMK